MATTAKAKKKVQFDTITGYLVVNKMDDAVKYYEKVFGAEEAERFQDPSGKVWHAQLTIQGTRLLLMESFEDMELIAPTKSAQGDRSMLVVFVKDVDETYKTALRAGGTGMVEPFESFWGDRYAEFRDPFGHRWGLDAPKTRMSAVQRGDALEVWRKEHGNPKSPAAIVRPKK